MSDTRFDWALVDGNYIARKMFHVHSELGAKVDGKWVHTGLAHGYLLQLIQLREEYADKIIVAWDAGIDRRRTLDPAYKLKRREKGSEWEDKELFEAHLMVAKWFLRLVGVRQVKKGGEEGDDILFTLANHLQGTRLIVSNDHDMYQALRENVFQLLSKKDGNVVMSARRLERETGLTPEGWGWVMALAGCSGDEIAGIPGVGLGTATEFVKQWPNLVPAILGQDPDHIPADWLPTVNGKNVVQPGGETCYFPFGDKGPGKRLLDCLKNPKVVDLTYNLTRLYDVWPVQFFKPPLDSERLQLELERHELQEVLSRFDTLQELSQ